MKLWFAIFLGLVQGATEFLPVSSSGHLSIFQNVFGMENMEQSHLFFDVLLHLGTLVSVCIVYRKDIAGLIKAFFSLFRRGESGAVKHRSSIRFLFLIIVATLPLVVVVFVKEYVEKLYYNVTFIGLALIVTGLLLFISDRVIKGKKNEKNATMLNAMFVGIAQAIAIVPGLSRSGTTITAGLFQGFDREFAVRFSFIMSIPAILGANILSLVEALKAGIDTSLLPVYLAGVAAATVSGLVAIKIVKLISQKDRFGSFAYYCWTVGLLVIILSIII
ncbi:MAG TPA: undecaprenyl-diphosphate phosphatase [Clostridiales bacterium]|nr:undecaprenyl-diphosphate phosphatase [Clostridiales bacterium]